MTVEGCYHFKCIGLQEGETKSYASRLHELSFGHHMTDSGHVFFSPEGVASSSTRDADCT